MDRGCRSAHRNWDGAHMLYRMRVSLDARMQPVRGAPVGVGDRREIDISQQPILLVTDTGTSAPSGPCAIRGCAAPAHPYVEASAEEGASPRLFGEPWACFTQAR